MAIQHPAALAPEELLKVCEIRRSRGGGPGGQHRNKTETAVDIRHLPTCISGQAGERRSQDDNRRMAIFRLRLNLALRVRVPREQNNMPIPSPLWLSRLKGERISVSTTHTDFPSLLAEALDILSEKGMDLKIAAELLQCTPTQLLKFIKQEPAAYRWLSGEREKLGLGRLF